MNHAIEDLEEIRNYIEKRSKKYALITVQNIRLRTQILKIYKEHGRIVPEYNDVNIRELIEGNYRIIYYVYSQNEIWILAIIHAARDFTKVKIDLIK